MDCLIKDEGNEKMVQETTLRVRYSETDAMGLVYHGNYLVWFEMGRTEWLRSRGQSYREMEAEGMMLPVTEAHCEYKASARYDDELCVRTIWQNTGDLYFEFRYEIIRSADAKLLATGWTRHLCVGKEGTILRKATIRFKNIFGETADLTKR